MSASPGKVSNTGILLTAQRILDPVFSTVNLRLSQETVLAHKKNKVLHTEVRLRTMLLWALTLSGSQEYSGCVDWMNSGLEIGESDDSGICKLCASTPNTVAPKILTLKYAIQLWINS